MEAIVVVLALLAVVLSAGCLVLLVGSRRSAAEAAGAQREMLEQVSALAAELDAQAQAQRQATALEQQRFSYLNQQMTTLSDRVDATRRETVQQLSANREATEARLDKIRETVSSELGVIRTDNAQQLDRMRATVDEKLSRTLNDRLSASFKQVSEQLEAVYKGLGDMQGIAAGVGDLKRVLGNVKTRGILGEVQLGAILHEILAPEQYEENVATKPGSSERVEFAVRIPVEDGEPVLLPIDSKFPGDAYEHLLDALDSGDADAVAAARKNLDTMIKREAKDISEKYLSVPATTSFGIMFLPFEGLYAEVVNRPGLMEELGRTYRVNVAGPSTMAALLNSLQMSYQTFALQKRTDDVLRVLSAVKAELPKYQTALRRAHQQIETAGKTVDSIITTRTNVMQRTLKSIDAMGNEGEPERVLGYDGIELLGASGEGNLSGEVES